MGVGSTGIVEPGDIGEKALLELLDGLVGTAVQLFPLQILEKAFHDRIVVGMTLRRKGLDHPRFIDHLAKIPGGEPASPIRMEHDALGNAPES